MLSTNNILAVDIDDTLATTSLTINTHILSQFGDEFKQLNPEILTASYFQPGEIPEWQSHKKILPLIYDLYFDESFLLSIKPFDDAVDQLSHLANHHQHVIYITSRPKILNEITQQWLNQNHFPSGKLVTRDPEIIQPDWKYTYLNQISTSIQLFEDDIYTFQRFQLNKFSGKFWWHNPYHHQVKGINSATPFTWDKLPKL